MTEPRWDRAVVSWQSDRRQHKQKQRSALLPKSVSLRVWLLSDVGERHADTTEREREGRAERRTPPMFSPRTTVGGSLPEGYENEDVDGRALSGYKINK